MNREVIISTQVLVVEDEKLVAADIQEHLVKLGYGVPGIISSGEDAIRSATDTRPDLVLMDIQLRGRIDGIETARILQSRLNIPVIYVTAFADDRTLQRAKSTEPYGYVLKPFGKKELQTAIELALHKHGRERRLRTNEQWLMGLLASIAAGIVAIDHNGLLCMMNPQAEEYTGTLLADALGCNWTSVIAFPANPRECPIHRALKENASSEMLDIPVLFPKTGHKAIIWGAVSPMEEPGGDGRAAILVFRDVTEWQDLEKHYRRTRHLDDMQRLAGGLAHQFSNFLTLISGYTESLARSIEAADPRSRDVHTVQKVTERAANLTRDLLTFSRNQPLNLKTLDPNHAVITACEVMKLTGSSSIAIEHDLDPSAGRIEADPAHLEQILMALVTNAVDSMPDGGTVTLRTSNLDIDKQLASKFVDVTPGAYVRIDVVDRGVGMSYETQTHVFEPFFTTKDRGRGIGLGLATVYGLIKQNRGHVWFESEPKKGTTFSICLPRIDGAASHAISVPRSLHGVETVLIAEEDPEARATLRDILLELGYRVLEAVSGQEVLKICEQQQEGIHLVISSVIMPNMTAHELASRLSAIRPGVKLLFTSPYSAFALRHHGLVDPGLPFLQRPFTADVLAKAIRDALAPVCPHRNSEF